MPSQVFGRDRLSSHAGRQEISRCSTRGESLGMCNATRTPPPSVNKAEPTLALKPRGDVTRSPKQGYQWPHKKGLMSSKNFKKKKKKKMLLNVCNLGYILAPWYVHETDFTSFFLSFLLQNKRRDSPSWNVDCKFFHISTGKYLRVQIFAQLSPKIVNDFDLDLYYTRERFLIFSK